MVRKSVYLFFMQVMFMNLSAQNPFIMNQFTADPSARVFEGRVYVYPSHDIPCGKGQGFIGFCMADYHVFSSDNLTDWKDHGVILSQDRVPWVDSTSYSMWAPDCIFKDGTYYFYFPARAKGRSPFRSQTIGVAVSDKPEGPVMPEALPMKDISGIDPNPFIDSDGQVYLYWASMKRLMAARLKDNMKELDSRPKEVQNLPKGFKEGPYLFERNGIYYFTYPHVADKIERLEYAIGDNPMGPFEYRGVIMDESPAGCWTNHHSILEYQGQWYLFYHHNDLSPFFDKNRSSRIDSLFFNEDGTIQKVTPTLRGVGITPADRRIQIDRYSDISQDGTSIDFIDGLNTHKGWKVILDAEDAWIRYNRVDFGANDQKLVKIKARSETGGFLNIGISDTDMPVISMTKIPESEDWNISYSSVPENLDGVHDLIVSLEDSARIEIDWITFE